MSALPSNANVGDRFIGPSAELNNLPAHGDAIAAILPPGSPAENSTRMQHMVDIAFDLAEVPPVPRPMGGQAVLTPPLAPPEFVGAVSHAIDVQVAQFARGEAGRLTDPYRAASIYTRDSSAGRDVALSEANGALQGDVAGSVQVVPSWQAPDRENPVDVVTSNSAEGGFVAIDDGSGAVPRLVPSAQSSADIKAEVIDGGGWIADLLPEVRRGTAAVAGAERFRSGDLSAAGGLSNPGRSRSASQGQLDAAEGGAIELANAVPEAVAPAAVRGTVAEAANADVGGAAQGVTDIRPDSGVGLYCDMEVAVGGGSPAEGFVSHALPAANVTPKAAATVRHSPGAKVTRLEPSQRLDSRQHDFIAAADNIPLFLTVVLVVLSDGIRLEAPLPDRERRFLNIERARHGEGG